MTSDNLTVEWIDGGREPRCPPDPRFPDGVDFDVTKGHALEATCQAALQCPAPRCGQWLIACSKCGQRILITAAGRRDDPRSVKIPCAIPINNVVLNQI